MCSEEQIELVEEIYEELREKRFLLWEWAIMPMYFLTRKRE